MADGPLPPGGAEADGRLACRADALRTGDRLLRLAGVQFLGACLPGLCGALVADVQACAEDQQRTVRVRTSAGTFLVAAGSAALAVRNAALTPGGVLLVSRRQSLHATLLHCAGVPIVRRSPVRDGRLAPAVSAQEWAEASVVVIDGYLASATLQAMWARGDLADRPGTLMVGTDPDDARVYARRVRARASALAILPYDEVALAALLRQACGAGASGEAHPWPGLLADLPAG